VTNINSVSSFCLGDSPINLNFAIPIGGTYTGIGVANNIFIPDINTIGINIITYNYSNSNGCSGSTTQNISVSEPTSSSINLIKCDTYTWGVNNQTYLMSGAYVDISTNSDGCTHTETLNLTINNSTSNTTSQTTCDTYTWGVNNQTYLMSGAYVDVSTNSDGCTHTETLNLTINNSTSNTTSQTTCDTYTWGVNNQTYLMSGTYVDISTNLDGCTHTETLNLIINNSTSNTTNNVACDSYTWLVNGNTYTASGNYTEISTNAAGCTHTEVLNLTLGYSDQLDLIIAENHISCFGYNDGSINITPNGGTPPFQYSWDNGAVSQTISALSTGDYSFSFTDSNGCTLDSVANINEANQIFLDFIATSPICRYDESILSINISNSTSNIYTVSLQDSILKSFVIDTNGLLIPVGVPITLSPNYSGEVYIVSLTDEDGCTGIYNDDVHIEVKQLPQLAINEVDVCEESPSFTLNNATPNGGFYSINNELTNYLDVENLGAGMYNVGYTYTDPVSSCSNQINEVITIMESPKAEMLFSPQPTDIDNPTIFFRDNSNEMVLYSEWDLGDGTIINDEINFWHTYSDTGTYTIKYYITNMYECTDSVIKDLTINPIYLTFIPDAFTPNNDGDNDYFYPSIIGGKDYNMKIYNRWGEIIYNEDNGTWDGKINNNLVQHGLYSYSILVNDFKNKRKFKSQKFGMAY
jgi:gliding motility-associated-like protein